MRKPWFALGRAVRLLFVGVASCAAGVLCPAQTVLTPTDPTTSYIYFDAQPGGGIERVAVQGQPFAHATRITVGATGANLWSAQCGWNTSQPLAPGDVLLLEFFARKIAPPTAGSIQAIVTVEQDGGDYAKVGVASLPADSAVWKRYAIPMRAGATFPAGPSRLAFQFAVGPQTFEIGGVRLTKYPATQDPRLLPAVFSYGGEEPDAAWRREAEDSIREHRTRAIRIEVVDAQGSPVRDAQVRVLQTRHAFKFGSAIAADRLVEQSPDGDRYRSAVTENFNATVIENHLKWPFFEEWNRAQTDGSFAWLRAHRLPVRGHNLIWPSAQNMPADVPGLPGAAMRARINAHFDTMLAYTRGKIYEWDVVNEPYDNVLAQGRIPGVPGVEPSLGVLGNHEVVSWFERARRLAPKVKLAVNDYGVWEGIDPTHRAYTTAYVAWLKQQGAPIDRLGLQAHFSNILIPIPELRDRLEPLVALGVGLAVTEYDTDTFDDALQARYLRDIMTLVFAEPAFDQFMLWGFWESAHWIPNGAFYREDWTPKPALAAWRELVFERWWTKAKLSTDSGGLCELRAFLGSHRVEASGVVGGVLRSAVMQVKLLPARDALTLRLTLR